MKSAKRRFRRRRGFGELGPSSTSESRLTVKQGIVVASVLFFGGLALIALAPKEE